MAPTPIALADIPPRGYSIAYLKHTTEPLGTLDEFKARLPSAIKALTSLAVSYFNIYALIIDTNKICVRHPRLAPIALIPVITENRCNVFLLAGIFPATNALLATDPVVPLSRIPAPYQTSHSPLNLGQT